MSTNRLVIAAFLLMGLGALTLAGCGSKVTKSNYSKITKGMTVAEVEGILGKGTDAGGVSGAIGKISGSTKVLKWQDGDKTITVTFVNDKAEVWTSSGL